MDTSRRARTRWQRSVRQRFLCFPFRAQEKKKNLARSTRNKRAKEASKQAPPNRHPWFACASHAALSVVRPKGDHLQASDCTFELKILVRGEIGTGKTCLVAAMTRGYQFAQKRIEEHDQSMIVCVLLFLLLLAFSSSFDTHSMSRCSTASLSRQGSWSWTTRQKARCSYVNSS